MLVLDMLVFLGVIELFYLAMYYFMFLDNLFLQKYIFKIFKQIMEILQHDRTLDWFIYK